MIEVDDKWVWDSWYCIDGDGVWHAFFLQADKTLGDADLRHWNVTFGHAVSRDLQRWDYLGTVFAPSENSAFDDFTVWTGCVISVAAGEWMLFYTGTSRNEGGRVQRIGRATSRDLQTWERQGLALDLSGKNAELYEDFLPERWKDRSMRDPWVIPDPEGQGWLMYFTARSPFPVDTNASGAIGLARSDNLVDWQLLPPTYVGSFGEIEVPQVFERGGIWYCLFCTTAACWSDAYRDKNSAHLLSGVHYLVGDGPRGPWRIAEGPFLLGSEECEHYAGRLVHHAASDWLLACNAGPAFRFSGTISDPIPVTADAGTLKLMRPAPDPRPLT